MLCPPKLARIRSPDNDPGYKKTDGPRLGSGACVSRNTRHFSMLIPPSLQRIDLDSQLQSCRAQALLGKGMSILIPPRQLRETSA